MDTLLKSIIKSIRYIVFIMMLFLLEVYLFGNESIFSFIIPIFLVVAIAYIHEIFIKSRGNRKILFIAFNFSEDLLLASYIIYILRLWNDISWIQFLILFFIGSVFDYFVYSKRYNKNFNL